MSQKQATYLDSQRASIIDHYLDDILTCMCRDYTFLDASEIDSISLRQHVLDLYLCDDNISFSSQLSIIDRRFFPYVSGAALRLYESIEARYETSEIGDKTISKSMNLARKRYGDKVPKKNPYVIRRSLVELLDEYNYNRNNVDFHRFSSEIFCGHTDVARYFFECVLEDLSVTLQR